MVLGLRQVRHLSPEPTLTLQIVRDEGPMGLLRGHSATLLRIFPYAAIKYMLYEEAHAVRRALCERC